MENQVAFLRSLGLSAIALHNEHSEEQLKEVEKGTFPYLFASPEKMLSVERWRRLLASDHYRKFLVVVTINEAHCISQWVLPGLNTKMTTVPFRIWYANLVELKSLTCDVPSIILTATASVSTKRYIFRTLNRKPSWCLILEHSPERPNVQFGVQYLDKNMPVSSTFSSLIEELRSKKFSRMSWKRLSLFRRHLTTKRE